MFAGRQCLNDADVLPAEQDQIELIEKIVEVGTEIELSLASVLPTEAPGPEPAAIGLYLTGGAHPKLSQFSGEDVILRCRKSFGRKGFAAIPTVSLPIPPNYRKLHDVH